MKITTIIILLLLSLTIKAQEQKFYKIADSLVVEFNSGKMSQECDSSDSEVKETDLIPISYDFLNNNDFCYSINPVLKNFTLNFSFRATSNSIFINAGYSIINCTTTSFNSISLYDNETCSNLGEGFIYSNLVIGRLYTWQVTGSTDGVFCEGFSSICPYYINTGSLSIELVNFTGKIDRDFVYIKWETASETNSDYFDLQRGDYPNNIYYENIYRIKGKGFSTTKTTYEYIDRNPKEGNNYYRIKETDLNGNILYYEPIVIRYVKADLNIIRVIDINGKDVSLNKKGHKIIIYENGKYINTITIE